MLQTGQIVTTPEGNVGQIARPASGTLYDFYEGRESIKIYSVILDSGKVERWAESALLGEGFIRRSGTLK